MVNKLSIVQFLSEIILVISNQTCAAHFFNLEIMHMISDQIALHAVQLPFSNLPQQLTGLEKNQCMRYISPMCCTKHYCSFEILTILGQCFQHIEQVHRDLPLCGPSGTRPQGKVQDAAAHQILPYLDIC